MSEEAGGRWTTFLLLAVAIVWGAGAIFLTLKFLEPQEKTETQKDLEVIQSGRPEAVEVHFKKR